jgi:hypothetical protein
MIDDDVFSSSRKTFGFVVLVLDFYSNCVYQVRNTERSCHTTRAYSAMAENCGARSISVELIFND